MRRAVGGKTVNEKFIFDKYCDVAGAGSADDTRIGDLGPERDRYLTRLRRPVRPHGRPPSS